MAKKKSKGMSPTQLTLKKLRTDGYTAAVVEKWNPHAGIRQDLFGFIDVLGVGEKGTIAVQCTTADHAADRIRKIEDHENLGAVREAGWQIEVHGWVKSNNRWRCNVTDIS